MLIPYEQCLPTCFVQEFFAEATWRLGFDRQHKQAGAVWNELGFEIEDVSQFFPEETVYVGTRGEEFK